MAGKTKYTIEVETKGDTSGVDKVDNALDGLGQKKIPTLDLSPKVDVDAIAASVPPIKVPVDTSEIDKAKEKLEQLTSESGSISQVGVDADTGEVDALTQSLDDLSYAEKMAEAEAELLRAQLDLLAKAERELTGDEKALVKEMERKEKALRSSAKEARVAQREMKKLKSEHSQAGKALGDTNKINDKFVRTQKNVRKSTRNSGLAMLEFARAFEDAQYGVRGVINNIPQLLLYLGLGSGLTGILTVGTVAIASFFGVFSHGTQKAKKDLIEFSGDVASFIEAIRSGDKEESIFDQISESIAEQAKGLDAVTSKLDRQISKASTLRDIELNKVASAHELKKLKIDEMKHLSDEEKLIAKLDLDRKLTALKREDETQSLKEQLQLTEQQLEAGKQKLAQIVLEQKRSAEKAVQLEKEIRSSAKVQGVNADPERDIENVAKDAEKKLKRNADLAFKFVKDALNELQNEDIRINRRDVLADEAKKSLGLKRSPNDVLPTEEFEKVQNTILAKTDKILKRYEVSLQDGTDKAIAVADLLALAKEARELRKERHGRLGVDRLSAVEKILNGIAKNAQIAKLAGTNEAEVKDAVLEIKKAAELQKELANKRQTISTSVERKTDDRDVLNARLEATQQTQKDSQAAQKITDQRAIQQGRQADLKRRFENALKNAQASKSQADGELASELPLLHRELQNLGRKSDAKLIAEINKAASDGLNKNELVVAQQKLNQVLAEGSTKQLQMISAAVEMLMVHQNAMDQMQVQMKNLNSRAGRIGK